MASSALSVPHDVPHKECYGNWNLNELKKELRSRGAKVSGRKTELVERLIAYDKNYNFKVYDITGPSIQEKNVTRKFKPDPALYRDVTSVSKIPVILKDNVKHFLNRFFKNNIDEKAVKMYQGKFLNNIRVQHCHDKCYILGNVSAEMKKKVTYNSELVLSDNTGEVLESGCDCAVGSWPDAHCKHVQLLLIALQDFVKGNAIVRKLVCTEKLQSFHHPPSLFTSSPMKCEDIPMKGVPKNLDFDPRPLQFRNLPWYRSYVNNLVVNFQCNKSPIPFIQLIPPANSYALELDHDYFNLTSSDHIIKTVINVDDKKKN